VKRTFYIANNVDIKKQEIIIFLFSLYYLASGTVGTGAELGTAGATGAACLIAGTRVDGINVSVFTLSIALSFLFSLYM
jgi:hypothetical protein